MFYESQPKRNRLIMSNARYIFLAGALTFLSLWNVARPFERARANSEVPSYPDWRITGPTGGDVRALVVDPNDPDRFYFGTLDGQIYTSTDGARTWRMQVNFNRPKLFVDHIIVDPRNSKVLYMGAHRHKEPGGFFKSTDGGLTWREDPKLRNEAVHSLTQSVADANVLVAGTFNGIFRSEDSGDSWEQLPTYSTPGLVH